MQVPGNYRDLNDTETRIMEASIRAFLRYGPKKLTMNDVAEEAGLARKTVYVAFQNRDTLLGEMVLFIARRQLTRVVESWKGCEGLADRLSAYARIVVLEPFDSIQATDDPQDMVNIPGQAGRIVNVDVRDLHAQLWADLLLPYSDRLKASGTSPERMARFIVTTTLNLKKSETERDRLTDQLNDLQTAVLAVTGDT